ncbi:MAG: hypothetical protein SPG81_01740 [Candidatus Egerieousia sp.]|nr:hypothetical protein [Candidatus Egerieousia sp.]
MLAKPECFSPPDEVCCWPGSRYGGAVAGQDAVAELHREDAAAPREPSGTIGKMLPFTAQQRCYREDAAVYGAAKMPSGRAACWGSC